MIGRSLYESLYVICYCQRVNKLNHREVALNRKLIKSLIRRVRGEKESLGIQMTD